MLTDPYGQQNYPSYFTKECLGLCRKWTNLSTIATTLVNTVLKTHSKHVPGVRKSARFMVPTVLILTRRSTEWLAFPIEIHYRLKIRTFANTNKLNAEVFSS